MTYREIERLEQREIQEFMLIAQNRKQQLTDVYGKGIDYAAMSKMQRTLRGC